jgi:asparagine synthase (glutamine-hydrolysing)
VELGAALQMPSPDIARTSDEALLARMIERWGVPGVARCLGAFAFARWEPDERRLTLGRDCIGVNHTLFFHRGRGFVAFATSLVILLSLSIVPREIDEIALANFFAANLRDGHRTYYRGIERVASRTLATIDATTIRHEPFWSPDFDAAPPFRRDEDYVERARELFDQAVATAVGNGQNLALAMSGGLDSSAIAATAARLGLADRLTCYTLVPPAGALSRPGQYQDESDKVRALGRLYPALDIRLLAPEAPHPLELDDTRYFARTGFPAHGGVNVGWFGYLNDAVAQAGHGSLIDGYFGGLALTWEGKFFLLALLRSGDWRTFARELRRVAKDHNHGVTRTFFSQVLIWNTPAWVRRTALRLLGRDPWSVAAHSALNPAFISENGMPKQWRDEGFDPWFRRSGWHPSRHRASAIFDFHQRARDFQALLFEQHGFETRSPHADRRLVEFALSVPEPVYHRNGVPRSFARAVFADRLPQEILQERRLGAQGGAWFRRLDARRQDVADQIESLESSPLACRMLDLPRLKRLSDELPRDESTAVARWEDHALVLTRGLHFGRFIRWVEGRNA